MLSGPAFKCLGRCQASLEEKWTNYGRNMTDPVELALFPEMSRAHLRSPKCNQPNLSKYQQVQHAFSPRHRAWYALNRLTHLILVVAPPSSDNSFAKDKARISDLSWFISVIYYTSGVWWFQPSRHISADFFHVQVWKWQNRNENIKSTKTLQKVLQGFPLSCRFYRKANPSDQLGRAAGTPAQYPAAGSPRPGRRRRGFAYNSVCVCVRWFDVCEDKWLNPPSQCLVTGRLVLFGMLECYEWLAIGIVVMSLSWSYAILTGWWFQPAAKKKSFKEDWDGRRLFYSFTMFF